LSLTPGKKGRSYKKKRESRTHLLCGGREKRMGKEREVLESNVWRHPATQKKKKRVGDGKRITL